jgi:hypothetical protein
MTKGGSRKHHRRGKHVIKGGASAAEYVTSIVGDLQTQLLNTLTTSNGQNAIIANSNDLVPIKASEITTGVPVKSQAGGKKWKAMGGKKSKKGGFMEIGAILQQAVVPFGLFGLQHSYSKGKTKSRGGKRASKFRTRRHRK